MRLGVDQVSPVVIDTIGCCVVPRRQHGKIAHVRVHLSYPPARHRGPRGYPGVTGGAFSSVRTEPEIVGLLGGSGMRTDAPAPIATLKRLKMSPRVSPTTTLVQPPPQVPPRHGR